MSIEIIETTETEPTLTPTDAPPDFGRCPVCGKKLFPHDEATGRFQAPPADAGFASRVKCTGCGTILYYLGDKRWRVLTPEELAEGDKFNALINQIGR